ncbi:MAG: signal peptidase II [Sandaracinus sp.]|nr:signal peptidase II [Sandaracinus sp.]MCB9615375.1 signal peptidase II [Sandaracinus sp.]MCB9634955.1 signal peptidase II [Sandaracinus sp.]
MTKKSEKPTFTPRTKAALAACLVATAALTAADLGSKAWAFDRLSAERVGEPPPVCQADEHGYIQYQRARMEPIVVGEGWFELRYAENCGAAFGLLRNATPALRHTIFGAAAILASLALLWMFASGRGGKWFAYSVPFIVSGAIGNLVDRLRLGYVVDFLRVYWDRPLPLIGSEWPTFNVADITITIGVGFLLVDGWLEGRREKAAERAAAAAEKPATT